MIRSNARAPGYLLMESLVAMLVMSAIVVSLLSSMKASTTESGTAKMQTQALTLCESKIEELRYLVALDPGLLAVPPLPGAASNTLNAPTLDPLYLADFTVSPLPQPFPWVQPDRLFRLDMSVHFRDDPVPLATLTTVIARRG